MCGSTNAGWNESACAYVLYAIFDIFILVKLSHECSAGRGKWRAAVHAGPPARLNESACDFALLTVRTISECFYYSRPVSARALSER